MTLKPPFPSQATYLPIFAFVVGSTCSLRIVQIIISSLAILISSIFFIGLQSIASKFSDPFGNMLYDLRVVKMISTMPVECENILTTHLPEDNFKPEQYDQASPQLQAHAEVGAAKRFMMHGGRPQGVDDHNFHLGHQTGPHYSDRADDDKHHAHRKMGFRHS